MMFSSVYNAGPQIPLKNRLWSSLWFLTCYSLDSEREVNLNVVRGKMMEASCAAGPYLAVGPTQYSHLFHDGSTA